MGGCDRLGNLIQVTQGAFGMARREHVWKLNLSRPDEAGRLAWTLVADNVSEIPASTAIKCSFYADDESAGVKRRRSGQKAWRWEPRKLSCSLLHLFTCWRVSRLKSG